jgi:tetratricopeptide (TPR) repeat protein
MSTGVSRALVAAACLLWLAGCESSTKPGFLFGGAAPDTTASIVDTKGALLEATDLKPRPVASPSEVTGTIPTPASARAILEQAPPGPWSAAQDPFDDLALGKRHYREQNYGLAENHFRTVVEQENVPAQRKAEAWVGLAASYDRLKRFDLADRAYEAAIRILGPTPEILNNQGFSYMLRGDYRRARAKLTQAAELDPTNPYIRNNLELLEKSMRGGGGKKKV